MITSKIGQEALGAIFVQHLSSLSTEQEASVSGAFAKIPGISILTTVLPLHRNANEFFTRTFQRFGDRVELNVLGRKALLLCNPDDIEVIFASDRDSYRPSEEIRNLRPIFGDGLLASEGELWRRQRRLIQPKFQHSTMMGYAAVMVECIAEHIAGWKVGDTFDIHPRMMTFTRDVVCRTLFGIEQGEDARAVAEAVSTVFGDLRTEILYLPLWRKLPLPRSIRWNRAVKVIDAAVDRMIRERRSATTTRSDLLGVLLDARDVDGSSMSDAQVHDEIMTMFLAGHETSALALTWALYLLASNPEAQDRVSEEIRRVTEGRSLRVEDLPQLEYLGAAVQETLRLCPPIWSIGRQSSGDTLLNGTPVGKGTHIWICTYQLHHDPRWFEEPEKFNPDRWLNKTPRKKFTYLPFGAGPRMCIGQHFATTETVLALAAILLRFRVLLAPGNVTAFDAWISLRPKNGVRVVLEDRASAQNK